MYIINEYIYYYLQYLAEATSLEQLTWVDPAEMNETVMSFRKYIPREGFGAGGVVYGRDGHRLGPAVGAVAGRVA